MKNSWEVQGSHVIRKGRGAADMTMGSNRGLRAVYGTGQGIETRLPLGAAHTLLGRP
jgi:hypothetical protein